VKLLPAKVPAAPNAALTLGACREQLKVNGYHAVSALLPDGLLLFYGNNPWHRPIPLCLSSEHPVAVDCSPLVLLVVSTADTDLREKIDRVLRRHKLNVGPTRVGTDGVRVHVLRASGTIRTSMGSDGTPTHVLRAYGTIPTCSALGGAVTFLGMNKDGPFAQSHTYEILPLDGAWHGGTLLDTSVADLPEITPELVQTVQSDLAEATAPPPAPPVKTRRTWLGG
jgi:hypothetical protein